MSSLIPMVVEQTNRGNKLGVVPTTENGALTVTKGMALRT